LPSIKSLEKISKRIRMSIYLDILIPIFSSKEGYIDLVSKRSRRIYYRISKENFPKDLLDKVQDKKEVIPGKYDF